MCGAKQMNMHKASLVKWLQLNYHWCDWSQFQSNFDQQLNFVVKLKIFHTEVDHKTSWFLLGYKAIAIVWMQTENSNDRCSHTYIISSIDYLKHSSTSIQYKFLPPGKYGQNNKRLETMFLIKSTKKLSKSRNDEICLLLI